MNHRHVKLGGLLYIAAMAQYAVAQLVTAAAWDPPYSWRRNYISDLGNTQCGMFAVPHAMPAFVCSPRHVLMNTSFVLSGGLIFVATALLWHFWPARRMTTLAKVFWLVSAVGKIAVGWVPENTHILLHTVAALNVPVGNVATLLLGLAVLRERKALALSAAALFLVGMSGTALSIAAQFAGPAPLLGFGSGGMERLADYPAYLWLAFVGAVTIGETSAPAPRRGVA